MDFGHHYFPSRLCQTYQLHTILWIYKHFKATSLTSFFFSSPQTVLNRHHNVTQSLLHSSATRSPGSGGTSWFFLEAFTRSLPNYYHQFPSDTQLSIPYYPATYSVMKVLYLLGTLDSFYQELSSAVSHSLLEVRSGSQPVLKALSVLHHPASTVIVLNVNVKSQEHCSTLTQSKARVVENANFCAPKSFLAQFSAPFKKYTRLCTKSLPSLIDLQPFHLYQLSSIPVQSSIIRFTSI